MVKTPHQELVEGLDSAGIPYRFNPEFVRYFNTGDLVQIEIPSKCAGRIGRVVWGMVDPNALDKPHTTSAIRGSLYDHAFAEVIQVIPILGSWVHGSGLEAMFVFLPKGNPVAHAFAEVIQPFWSGIPFETPMILLGEAPGQFESDGHRVSSVLMKVYAALAEKYPEDIGPGMWNYVSWMFEQDSGTLLAPVDPTEELKKTVIVQWPHAREFWLGKPVLFKNKVPLDFKIECPADLPIPPFPLEAPVASGKEHPTGFKSQINVKVMKRIQEILKTATSYLGLEQYLRFTQDVFGFLESEDLLVAFAFDLTPDDQKNMIAMWLIEEFPDGERVASHFLQPAELLKLPNLDEFLWDFPDAKETSLGKQGKLGTFYEVDSATPAHKKRLAKQKKVEKKPSVDADEEDSGIGRLVDF